MLSFPYCYLIIHLIIIIAASRGRPSPGSIANHSSRLLFPRSPPVTPQREGYDLDLMEPFDISLSPRHAQSELEQQRGTLSTPEPPSSVGIHRSNAGPDEETVKKHDERNFYKLITQRVQNANITSHASSKKSSNKLKTLADVPEDDSEDDTPYSVARSNLATGIFSNTEILTTSSMTSQSQAVPSPFLTVSFKSIGTNNMSPPTNPNNPLQEPVNLHTHILSTQKFVSRGWLEKMWKGYSAKK